MSDLTLNPRRTAPLRALWTSQRVWLAAVALLASMALVDVTLAQESFLFAVAALWHTAPFLVLSILVAAYCGATGADRLVARAFTGSPLLMILLASIAGALSPFCSCGVIPLIAALLAMGVPLSAVMAFWLASPVMDPSMFVITAGVLGPEFAVAKTLAAAGIGMFGGLVVHLLSRGGAFERPLRDGVGDGGCGGARVRAPGPVVWRFWDDPGRRAKFGREALSTTLFLARWLFLAFLLESLMLALVPAERVTVLLGGDGVGPIVVATLVGVPAYLNGYAALPLVGGLIAQGMAPGAGLAFLVAGGVTSIPAAMAVWALARPPVFALYIGLSLTGAFTAGLLMQVWTML
ncbi:permease [Oceanomicrobium pacificus]|uniref:Permease n=1 Tax=Oceanomicrobium pacificus TaxID=2692916 RepID=A0A6B0TX07_9RHOB|nr:permease [Oceanomicrobium pacificus]MXU66028.1 permease [Oceanomicrobium pacificus]